jgi:hypothetical protein
MDQQPPQTGYSNRLPVFRFGLAGFLLLVLVGGALIGLQLRSRFGVVNHRFAARGMDGYMVEGVWKTKPGFPDKLVFLLAYPRGRTIGGLTSGMEVPVDKMGSGITRVPSGLYIDGEPMGVAPGKRVWMYCWLGGRAGTVTSIPVSEDIERIQWNEFEQLNQHPAWPTIKAALDEQSKESLRLEQAERQAR